MSSEEEGEISETHEDVQSTNLPLAALVEDELAARRHALAATNTNFQEEDDEVIPVGTGIPLDADWNDDVLIRAWDAAMDEYVSLVALTDEIVDEDPKAVSSNVTGKRKTLDDHVSNETGDKRRQGSKDTRKKTKRELPGRKDMPFNQNSYTEGDMEEMETREEKDVSSTNQSKRESQPAVTQSQENTAPGAQDPAEQSPNTFPPFTPPPHLPFASTFFPKSSAKQNSQQDADDLTASMMMSWYYAGYYTGLYAAKNM
jgi:hypothetical protein